MVPVEASPPTFLTAVAIGTPPAVAPTMDSVAPPAPDDWLRVMLFPPTKRIPLLTVPVVPAVLPPLETPAENDEPPPVPPPALGAQ